MIYLMCSFERTVYSFIFLDSSMVEHSAVNRVVVGSSPTRGVVRTNMIYHTEGKLVLLACLIRLHGQAVKTPPFHGGIRGSNPLGVIFVLIYEYNKIWRHSQVVRRGTATP